MPTRIYEESGLTDGYTVAKWGCYCILLFLLAFVLLVSFLAILENAPFITATPTFHILPAPAPRIAP